MTAADALSNLPQPGRQHLIEAVRDRFLRDGDLTSDVVVRSSRRRGGDAMTIMADAHEMLTPG